MLGLGNSSHRWTLQTTDLDMSVSLAGGQRSSVPAFRDSDFRTVSGRSGGLEVENPGSGMNLFSRVEESSERLEAPVKCPFCDCSGIVVVSCVLYAIERNIRNI
jgi:hypothetical protein